MIVENYVSDFLQLTETQSIGAPPVVFWALRPTPSSPVTTYVVLVRITRSDDIVPTWSLYEYFDPVTGTYLHKLTTSPDPRISQYTIFTAFMERDGSVWFGSNIAGQTWNRMTLEEKSELRWDPAGATLAFSDYEYDLSWPFGIDSGRRLVFDCDGNALRVFSMDTKLLVRTVSIGSAGRHILLEDEERAFVICDYGIVVLVNYVSGVVMGTFRIVYHEDQAEAQKTYAWDRFTRRLLVISDGAGTRIRGYYPIPVAVGLTTPIPLQVPREGRTIRVATRAYGDAGEGIGGLRLDASIGADARLRSPKVVTGYSGWAFHQVKCLNAADVTFEVETEELP